MLKIRICCYPQWISFGSYTEMAQEIKAAGVKLIIQVQKLEEALHAAELGAAAVVAQVKLLPLRATHSLRHAY